MTLPKHLDRPDPTPLPSEDGVDAAVDCQTPRPMAIKGRPTAVRALFSPCVTPTWAAGVLLFACLWLPQFTGCDGVDVRPIDRFARADGWQEQLGAAFLLWPHWFGLLTAVALITVAAVRPAEPGPWLLIAPAALWLVMVVGCVLWILLRPPPSLREWLELLLWVPIILVPGVWAAFAARHRHWLSAWARITSALALLAYPSLVVATFPSQNSLYGLSVALAAAACLAPMAWILRWRGRRTLLDRDAPTEPIRFGLRHLILYTTLVAATLTYYRVVPWLVDQAQR